MLLNKTDIIHIIGIGGIGMSGIAEIMSKMGYRVQGSDANKNNNTKRLNCHYNSEVIFYYNLKVE